jgi:hypothetical protein
MVVDVRKVAYQNRDADGMIIPSVGWEIGREVKLCRSCAKMEPIPEPAPIDYTSAGAAAEARAEHARRCKKPIDECKLCQDSIRWFGSLPLQTLSEVLTDRGPNHTKKGH